MRTSKAGIVGDLRAHESSVMRCRTRLLRHFLYFCTSKASIVGDLRAHESSVMRCRTRLALASLRRCAPVGSKHTSAYVSIRQHTPPCAAARPLGVSICTYVCMYVCMCVCVCMHRYIYVYAYIHAYIHL